MFYCSVPCSVDLRLKSVVVLEGRARIESGAREMLCSFWARLSGTCAFGILFLFYSISVNQPRRDFAARTHCEQKLLILPVENK